MHHRSKAVRPQPNREMQLRAFAQEVLSYLDGLAYGDVRVVRIRSEYLKLKNGRLEAWSDEETLGFGVRVLVDGAWGFASSLELSSIGGREAAAEAVRRAAASARVTAEPVRLASVAPHVAQVFSDPAESPFLLSPESKLEFLHQAAEPLVAAGVTFATASLGAVEEEKVFASTEGSLIEQRRTTTGGGIDATMVRDGDVQIRSYPAAHDGGWGLGGFELVRAFDLAGNAPRIAEEARALLDAETCPTLRTTVILDADQVALQLHESIGHPTELDRILGTEASYAGTSFVHLEDLGHLRYGSPLLNVTADATTAGALGTIAFDDEGVAGQSVPLIRKGILVGLQSSRETAPLIGRSSSGAMRASGWNRIPLVRMTNINLEPGESSLEQLIAETEEGVLMSTNKGWSIDDRRLNVNVATEIGWKIEKGELKQMLRDCTYSGVTPAFWGSLDGLGKVSERRVVGLTNCGKGEPGQSMPVAHAVVPARFRSVAVGEGE